MADFSMFIRSLFVPSWEESEEFGYAKEQVAQGIADEILESKESFIHMREALVENDVKVEQLDDLLYRIAAQPDFCDVAIELREFLHQQAHDYAQTLALLRLTSTQIE